MEPFTFDQAVVAGLLFLLGLLIGMYLFASPKWKRRYKAEHARTVELEREVERLGREHREVVARTTTTTTTDRHPATGPLGAVYRDRDGTPDGVDRVVRRRDAPVREGPEVRTTRDWTPVKPTDRRP